MSFQAFENKRKCQLGNLTRRRKQVDDLGTIDFTKVHIKFQRDELEKIRQTHEEITNAMGEQPECAGDLAERLNENIEKFYEAYDQLQSKLTDYEIQLSQGNQTMRHEEIPVDQEQTSTEAISKVTNNQQKAMMEMGFNSFYNFISVLELEEADNFSSGQLQSMLSDIKLKMKKCEDLYEKVMFHADENERNELDANMKKATVVFYRSTAWLHQKVEEKSNLRVSPSTTSTNSQLSTRIKLPPIDLPKFNGFPETWIPFRDLYIAMIHDNAQLSGSQKYRYLKTSIVDNLSPIKFDAETDAGYEDAWKKVLAFYDDKRKIIVNHFVALLNAKKMSSESSEELQKLINDFNSNIDALERLLTKEELFDAFSAHIAAQRLDAHTRDLWESENTADVPTWPTMRSFLEKRRKTLTAISQSTDQKRSTQEPVKSRVHHASSDEAYEKKCSLCSNAHRLNNCSKFLSWDVNQRHAFVKEKKLCFNCFGKMHNGNECPSIYRCRTCKQMHHTLLHFTKSDQAQTSSLSSDVNPFVPYRMEKSTFEGQSTSHTATAMEATSSSSKQTLLSTVAVYLKDDEGNRHLCRALLDSGSDSNFMTANCAKKMNLKLQETCVSLSGINEKTSIIRHKTNAMIESHHGPFKMNLNFSVMSQISGNLPIQDLSSKKFHIPSQCRLADPKFKESTSIDMLLNAEVFYESLLGDKFRLPEGPMLIHTKFGWTLGGEMKDVNAQKSTTLLSCFSRARITDGLQEIETSLNKIFETEEIDSSKPVQTDEEIIHYQVNVVDDSMFGDLVPLTYNQKNHVIISNCNYAAKIIQDHQKHLYLTKSTLHSLIFQRFWILKAKNIGKKVQREYERCFHEQLKAVLQLVADLPLARVKLKSLFMKN